MQASQFYYYALAAPMKRMIYMLEYVIEYYSSEFLIQLNWELLRLQVKAADKCASQHVRCSDIENSFMVAVKPTIEQQ